MARHNSISDHSFVIHSLLSVIPSDASTAKKWLETQSSLDGNAHIYLDCHKSLSQRLSTSFAFKTLYAPPSCEQFTYRVQLNRC